MDPTGKANDALMRTVPAYHPPGKLRGALETGNLTQPQRALVTGQLGKPLRSGPSRAGAPPHIAREQFAGSEVKNLYRCVHSPVGRLRPLGGLGATKSDVGSLASSRMEDAATPAVSFSATANISEVAVGASAGE